MIWGMTLEPGKLYTEVMGDEVHLSMATLESRKDFVPATDEKPDSICHIIMKTEKSEYLLCTLVNGNIYQQNLDLKLMPREKVTFSVQGSNVVYLTGYSTSYPDIDDQFEDELSETGDWEPYDMGETSLDNTEEAIALGDEVIPVKGEAEDLMEDVIEDMADEQVQQPVTVVQLDNPEDPEHEDVPQGETEETERTEEAEQQEMIFSIAELEANVKEEPDDGITLIPQEAEERLQGHDQTQQHTEADQTLQDTHQQMQQQMQQQTQQQLHHQQHSQQQMHQQNQQQMQQQQQSQLQQHLQPQVQFLPNVQSTVQTSSQGPSTSHQRTPVHINQRGPRFAQRPRIGRGRPPLASRAVQRQRMRYMSPSNAQQTFQQQQSSASYPQMQNVQGNPARMPVAYQGTTVRNVTPSAQMSQQVVNNPQVQGQVMLNQPGTSRQGAPGSSTGNSSLNSQGILSRSTQRGKATCNICGMVCNETSLRRHQATHGDMRPYQCTFCGRRFQRSDNCRSHERSHTHRGFYKCQFCGKGYSRSNLRNAHERTCRASISDPVL